MNKIFIALLAAGAVFAIAGVICGKRLTQKHYTDADLDRHDDEDDDNVPREDINIDIDAMDISASKAVLNDDPAETADAQN